MLLANFSPIYPKSSFRSCNVDFRS